MAIRETPTQFEAFLSEALPPLGLSPAAHRRRNIRRRLMRRMEGLGIHEFPRYLEYLRRTPEESEILRSLLPVTISRFFRNGKVFDVLAREVLPDLVRKGTTVNVWSAGCASGEEPYTLRIVWEELPGKKPPLFLLATDIDSVSLARAQEGIYGDSSLREVPAALLGRYFARQGEDFRIRGDLKEAVRFRRHDLLSGRPPGRFDLILCRNAAFTYFGPQGQLTVAHFLASALHQSGFLVLGRTERLPVAALSLFDPVHPGEKIYRLRGERPREDTG
ncbi:MAG: protein-glutamate O-methyltransferase CheR [Deltaproteobacteria bacterium]|nr:protein-glutamate O-methyltransferase CheR [Deltaproteobacteria bacterium]